jgi:hypothetical protein
MSTDALSAPARYRRHGYARLRHDGRTDAGSDGGGVLLIRRTVEISGVTLVGGAERHHDRRQLSGVVRYDVAGPLFGGPAGGSFIDLAEVVREGSEDRCSRSHAVAPKEILLRRKDVLPRVTTGPPAESVL